MNTNNTADYALNYAPGRQMGFKGLCYSLYWDSYDRLTRGTNQEKEEVLRWINGGSARITWADCCQFLGYDPSYHRKLWLTRKRQERTPNWLRAKINECRLG